MTRCGRRPWPPYSNQNASGKPGAVHLAGGYQGYGHSITFLDGENNVVEQWFYIGITSRGWLERMEEHAREMRTGSNKRFHAAWRKHAGDTRVLLGSELIVLDHTYEGIMAWEEEQVDVHFAAGNSLNMIPGGFKGLKFLHGHRIPDHERVSLEERDAAIAEYVRRGAVKAEVPNLLLAKLWQDDEFYLKVLAGRQDVLTPAQVLKIRALAMDGKGADEICLSIGARNVDQVKRVLAGKTYSRIS